MTRPPLRTRTPLTRKAPCKPAQTPKPFALPPQNTDDRRVFAYLRKRGIAAQVIRQFMNSGLLYEDAEHHNCVFVGRNSAGQAKYACLRGTYDRDGKGFRGDATGSDKNTGFHISSDPSLDLVRMFEAPIDLMSYLSLHREPINNRAAPRWAAPPFPTVFAPVSRRVRFLQAPQGNHPHTRI